MNSSERARRRRRERFYVKARRISLTSRIKILVSQIARKFDLSPRGVKSNLITFSLLSLCVSLVYFIIKKKKTFTAHRDELNLRALDKV